MYEYELRYCSDMCECSPVNLSGIEPITVQRGKHDIEPEAACDVKTELRLLSGKSKSSTTSARGI